MTALEVVGAEHARQLTDRIKVAVEGTWHLIAEAYESRAWSVLGYSSWDDYCTREFGTARLKLPKEDRISTVQSLRDAGLSVRAIAAATGDSKSTVAEIASGVQIRTPEPLVVDESTGEVVDELTQRIANEMAASDAAFAETAREVTKVTGIDGKQYAPKAPAAARRKPLVDAATSLGWDIRKVMERLERLVGDDRLKQNEEQVARALRTHLLYAQDTVTAVLAQIP